MKIYINLTKYLLKKNFNDRTLNLLKGIDFYGHLILFLWISSIK